MSASKARAPRLVAVVLAGSSLVACGNRASTEDIARAAMGLNQEAAASAAAVASTDPAVPTADTAAAPTLGSAPAPVAPSHPADQAAGTKTTSTATGVKRAATGGHVGPSGGQAASTPGAGPAPATGANPSGASRPAATAAGGVCTSAKAPVIVGTVGNQSGIVGAAVYPGVKAVQAWMTAQNERGGLDCHPLRYVVADDGGDPSRHLTLVKRLVEQEGVIGFVYFNAQLSGQASADYLRQKQIPAMGQEGGSTYFTGSTMHFSAGSYGIDLIDLVIAATSSATVPLGKTKLATLTCQEATWCNLADERWPKDAARYGYQLVSKAKASITQPDFTSQCLSAQSAGADVMLGAFDPNAWKRVAQSCAQVGYKPVFGAAVAMTRFDFKDDPNLEGMVIAEPNLPWFLDAFPAVKEFQATLKRHAPGLQADASTLSGWAAAKLFERAARGNLSETPTNRDLLRGLWSFKDETLGGLAPPLTFSEGQPPVYPVCGWAVVIKNKTFTNSGEMKCFK